MMRPLGPRPAAAACLPAVTGTGSHPARPSLSPTRTRIAGTVTARLNHSHCHGQPGLSEACRAAAPGPS
eukprot:555427-Hanusia_phi.AAC.1